MWSSSPRDGPLGVSSGRPPVEGMTEYREGFMDAQVVDSGYGLLLLLEESVCDEVGYPQEIV